MVDYHTRPVCLEGLSEFVDEWMSKNLTPLDPATDISLETWLKQTNYDETRKGQLRDAYSKRIGRKPNVTVKSFVKDEMYMDVKHSRGIFARHDEFKTAVGPVFKCIEQALFSGPKTSKYFIKKIPSPDRPAFVMNRLFNKGSQTMATDYTAFESHFVAKLMEAVEFRLYRYMTQTLHCPDFKRYFPYIKSLNSVSFKNFTALVMATRMSGEMNTSLGNSFVNLMVYLYLHRNNTNVDCLVEGDDCLGVFDGECPTSEDYEKLGLTVKIERPTSINTASFCGQVFSSDLTTLTDPLKFIVKFNWSSSKYLFSSDKKLSELAKAKAMSALYSYPRCPIVTAFAKYVYRTSGEYWRIDSSASNWEKNRLKTLLRDFKLPTEPVSEESRIIVRDLWGFTPAQQVKIEEFFDNLKVRTDFYEPMLNSHASTIQSQLFWQFVQEVPIGWCTPNFWVFKFNGESSKGKTAQDRSKAPSTKGARQSSQASQA